MRLNQFKPPVDAYMLLLVATVVFAIVLPVSGSLGRIVSQISYAAVALLFFLYGAKLKTQAVVEGMTNWRVQALIFSTTYLFFPLLGVCAAFLLRGYLPDELLLGIIYLTILPSTVQSSIALTGMAGGNVSAAICAASLSNLVGVVLTPALATFLLSTGDVVLGVSSVVWICIQILVPFAVGQLLRPFIGSLVERNKLFTTVVDRGSILLIVYSAFSAGMVAGVWSRIDTWSLMLVVAVDILILLIVMLAILSMGRLAGLRKGDRVSFLFCGAQKSLASGVPIANILFAGHAISMVILPLMLFHQLQLFVSAYLAQRFARQDAGD